MVFFIYADATSFGVNGSTMPVGAAAPVDRISLVAPGAMTHSLDMNQRVVFLQVRSSTGMLLASSAAL